jgi:hypothetical protein
MCVHNGIYISWLFYQQIYPVNQNYILKSLNFRLLQKISFQKIINLCIFIYIKFFKIKICLK